jgi:hypothetical protein
MNMDYYLPRPTEDELNLGHKSEYFTRVLDMDFDKKYKITQQELTSWIHHNYQSIFLLDQELNLTQLKKLK